MRFGQPIRFLVISCLAVSCGTAFADAFKSTPPQGWKKISKKGDNAVFWNSRSADHEMVVLQVLSSPGKVDERKALTNLKTVTELREKFLNRYGIGNYTALSIETQPTKMPGFRTCLVIESLFRDLKNRDVQMLERHYFVEGKTFAIAYLIDGPALNDRVRANRILDNFQPISRSRTASLRIDLLKEILEFAFYHVSSAAYGASADEIVNGFGGDDTSETQNSTNTATPPSKVIETKMSNAEIGHVCSDVEESRRRTANDPSFTQALTSNTGSMGKSCLWGLGSGAWDIVKSPFTATVSYLKAEKAYFQCTFSKECRDRVDSMMGITVAQIAKDPSAFARRVGAEMYNAIEKNVGDAIHCFKPEEQMKMICKVASNLIPFGILGKVVSKVPLAAAETARLSKYAREAMGIRGAAEGTESVGTAEKLAEATSGETKGSSTIKVESMEGRQPASEGEKAIADGPAVAAEKITKTESGETQGPPMKGESMPVRQLDAEGKGPSVGGAVEPARDSDAAKMSPREAQQTTNVQDSNVDVISNGNPTKFEKGVRWAKDGTGKSYVVPDDSTLLGRYAARLEKKYGGKIYLDSDMPDGAAAQALTEDGVMKSIGISPKLIDSPELPNLLEHEMTHVRTDKFDSTKWQRAESSRTPTMISDGELYADYSRVDEHNAYYAGGRRSDLVARQLDRDAAQAQRDGNEELAKELTQRAQEARSIAQGSYRTAEEFYNSDLNRFLNLKGELGSRITFKIEGDKIVSAGTIGHTLKSVVYDPVTGRTIIKGQEEVTIYLKPNIKPNQLNDSLYLELGNIVQKLRRAQRKIDMRLPSP